MFLDKTKADLNDPLRRLQAFVNKPKGVMGCRLAGTDRPENNPERDSGSIPSKDYK